MKRKPGRPPSAASNAPRFMANRSRVTRTVVMPAPTAALLQEYVRWGARVERITEDEAMAYTMEQALGDLIRADRMFADAQREGASKAEPGKQQEHSDSAAAPPSVPSTPKPAAANGTGTGPQSRPSPAAGPTP